MAAAGACSLTFLPALLVKAGQSQGGRDCRRREAHPRIGQACFDGAGLAPVSWTSPPFGLSAAERHVVLFDNGTRAFVKVQRTRETTSVADQRVRPARAGRRTLRAGGHGVAERRGQPPVLVTTDLSSGHWPAAGCTTVQWRAGDIDAVLATLEQLRAPLAGTSLPPGVMAAALLVRTGGAPRSRPAGPVLTGSGWTVTGRRSSRSTSAPLLTAAASSMAMFAATTCACWLTGRSDWWTGQSPGPGTRCMT